MGTIRNLITASAAAALATGCVVADSGSTLELFNDSSYVIVEVHLAEVGDRTWGPDLVPDDLFPGESLVITGIDCGDYDVMVVDETKRRVRARQPRPVLRGRDLGDRRLHARRLRVLAVT